jgi:hypothetical protein
MRKQRTSWQMRRQTVCSGESLWSTPSLHSSPRDTSYTSAMISKLVYESNRVFSVFGYAMSHGVLLLRSGKSNETPTTRVDIMFQDVRALEIRMWFKGIRIEEVDPSYLDGQKSKPEEMIEPGNIVYALTSSRWQGFIVAGIVRFHEDDGDLVGPSAIVESPPIKRWTVG